MYGHHHLMVSDVDAARRFWVGTLGGTALTVGATQLVKFPNVLIFMNEHPPAGGSKGTTVNHIAFQVPDIRVMVDNVTRAGYRMATREELPSQYAVEDDLASMPDLNTRVAFVMAPDNAKVEFFENPVMRDPIAFHHIHFAAPDVEKMRSWYVTVLGAKPARRGSFEAADLPGVNLTYSPAPQPVVGTRGRAIDRIGFEVRDLEKFCHQLEVAHVTLDRGYTKVPALGIAMARLTDPWGTDIELAEGLGKIQ